MNPKSINHMRNLKQLVLAATIMVCIMGSSTDAFAECGYGKNGCTCQTMYYLDNAHNIHTDWIQMNEVFFPDRELMCTKHTQAKCDLATITKAKLLQYAPVGSANFLAICNAGGVNVDWDTKVDGKKTSRSGSCFVKVSCSKTPPVCKCPADWTCNGCSPQVAGGNTSDGKCKKVACQANTIPPYPPDGTSIGTWGFSWGNAFIAWGTTANGGAPKCAGGEWNGYN